MSKEVYIVSTARTPVGSFGGALASISAPKLGSIAIKAALERAGIDAKEVHEVFMGNVLTAGEGQAPARQAAIYAGISTDVPCTTINKVCASGMKAIMVGAQSILLGDCDVVVAGGMENMSQVPYYLPKARTGYRLGHGEMQDGILRDGLVDAYDGEHMGLAAELCAEECGFSREQQDEYAIQSYKRAAAAAKSGKSLKEIVPVEVPRRKKDPLIVSDDEGYSQVVFEKVPKLRAVFKKDGTVTAANASTLNDGAAAVVLMSGEKVKELGVKPIAKIVSYADAAREPKWFTMAPAKAMPKAVAKAGLSFDDIDFFEINEAFSVVVLANNKEMKLDPAKVNVYGGGVSVGHPIGCSGARIIVTLLNVLKTEGGKRGAAGICNGGGGASAMVVELV